RRGCAATAQPRSRGFFEDRPITQPGENTGQPRVEAAFGDEGESAIKQAADIDPVRHPRSHQRRPRRKELLLDGRKGATEAIRDEEARPRLHGLMDLSDMSVSEKPWRAV